MLIVVAWQDSHKTESTANAQRSTDPVLTTTQHWINIWSGTTRTGISSISKLLTHPPARQRVPASLPARPPDTRMCKQGILTWTLSQVKLWRFKVRVCCSNLDLVPWVDGGCTWQWGGVLIGSQQRDASWMEEAGSDPAASWRPASQSALRHNKTSQQWRRPAHSATSSHAESTTTQPTATTLLNVTHASENWSRQDLLVGVMPVNGGSSINLISGVRTSPSTLVQTTSGWLGATQYCGYTSYTCSHIGITQVHLNPQKRDSPTCVDLVFIGQYWSPPEWTI